MSLGGHDDEHGGRGFQYNLAAGSRSHSEPTYSEDDNKTVTAGMMAVDAANEESRIRAPPAPSLPVPIEGAYKIRSGQVMHDESVKQSNNRRNAFSNANSTSSNINSFFRRDWEHLADNMSRKIDAGIVLLATYPEALAAKAYMSPGFQKHVPGKDSRYIVVYSHCTAGNGGKLPHTMIILLTLASNFLIYKSFESSLLALKERLDNFDEKLETGSQLTLVISFHDKAQRRVSSASFEHDVAVANNRVRRPGVRPLPRFSESPPRRSRRILSEELPPSPPRRSQRIRNSASFSPDKGRARSLSRGSLRGSTSRLRDRSRTNLSYTSSDSDISPNKACRYNARNYRR
ncbi:hypothetical protein BC829DRAFT_384428 [Chytridium lagenaria]|nr:hypothetical protein BC829DRAFT_384428 [Chytridium lagenaria]